jgi:hypothetical protein
MQDREEELMARKAKRKKASGKRQRIKRTGRGQTRVRVLGNNVVLQVADGDIDQAIACLRSNGEIRYRFSELRVRQFPTDMIFEPRASLQPLDGDDGDDGDSDGDGDGADYDID